VRVGDKLLKHIHHWLRAYSGWHPGLLNETALASVMKSPLTARVCFNNLSLTLPRYNKQHKQNQGTLALLVRVVAKINVRIEQNPGYWVLKYFEASRRRSGSIPVRGGSRRRSRKVQLFHASPCYPKQMTTKQCCAIIHS
jgi:hypothetical protein